MCQLIASTKKDAQKGFAWSAASKPVAAFTAKSIGRSVLTGLQMSGRSNSGIYARTQLAALNSLDTDTGSIAAGRALTGAATHLRKAGNRITPELTEAFPSHPFHTSNHAGNAALILLLKGLPTPMAISISGASRVAMNERRTKGRIVAKEGE